MAGNGGQKPAGDGAADQKRSEPDRKLSPDSAAQPERFPAGPGTLPRPTTVSPSQTYSNLMYMKRSHNQSSQHVGKANPNQEAKFTAVFAVRKQPDGSSASPMASLHQMLARESGQAGPSGREAEPTAGPRVA